MGAAIVGSLSHPASVRARRARIRAADRDPAGARRRDRRALAPPCGRRAHDRHCRRRTQREGSRVSALWLAYRVLAPCLGALAPAGRVFASPDERPLWGERLGRLAATGPVDAWIHAASLGESVGVPPLVRELAARRGGATFHLTATTRSGRMRLASSPWTTTLAPLDAPQAIARFLAAVRPRRAFILETELWPHWLIELRRERIPTAIVSARLSSRSVRRYRRLGQELRGLVQDLAAVLCQTGADRDRWLAIGALPERTAVVGNLKSDALPGPVESRAAAKAALGLAPDRPLLVLASVRPGEPAIAARAWAAL